MRVYITSGDKQYSLGIHALNRMSQRRIKRVDIEKTLENSDIHHTDVQGNDCFIRTLQDGRRLRVVVEKNSNPLIIVTIVVLD